MPQLIKKTYRVGTTWFYRFACVIGGAQAHISLMTRLKVHLELSFNHINWPLINSDNINFKNLKNKTISKILDICPVFNVQLKKRLWILFAIKCSYINSRRKYNPLDNGLLLSQNDSAKTEMWKALKIAQIFTVCARKFYLLDHNFGQLG